MFASAVRREVAPQLSVRPFDEIYDRRHAVEELQSLADARCSEQFPGWKSTFPTPDEERLASTRRGKEIVHHLHPLCFATNKAKAGFSREKHVKRPVSAVCAFVIGDEDGATNSLSVSFSRL